MSMISIAGIADIKSSAELEQNASEKIHRAVRSCGRTLKVEYSRAVNRLTVPVHINKPNEPLESFFVPDAVFDTGSSGTVISSRFAQERSLVPVDTGIGVSATGKIPVNYYIIDLRISDQIVFPGIKVVGFPLSEKQGDCLIGMDVINQGNLSVLCKNGNTIMSFSMG